MNSAEIKKLDRGWKYSFDVLKAEYKKGKYSDKISRVVTILKNRPKISLEELVKLGNISDEGIRYITSARGFVNGILPHEIKSKRFNSLKDYMAAAGIDSESELNCEVNAVTDTDGETYLFKTFRTLQDQI